MEWKIGEIFEYNGEWYQCVEGRCKDCHFSEKRYLCKQFIVKNFCLSGIIFKKLERVGEPYEFQKRTIQTYKIYTEPFISVDMDFIWAYLKGSNTIDIIIKQDIEDMEEKNNGNTPLNVLTDKYVNGDICYDDFEKEVKALYSCKEEIKPTLKKFDLEAAKQGKPVCTRNGRKARIICFDMKEEYSIVALTEEEDNTEKVGWYYDNGKYLSNGEESPIDLMMLPEKRSGWAKVRKDINLYDTKEDADRKMIGNDEYVTAKVCWEV